MLTVMDRLMPGMNGIEVCRKLRENHSDNPTYIILLTSLSNKDDIAEGLDAGANDYITKPFDFFELNARIGVGQRVIELQTSLHTRVQKLEDTLEHVKTLQSILPICIHCHGIRNDNESWKQIDKYLTQHPDVKLGHARCEKCLNECNYSASP